MTTYVDDLVDLMDELEIDQADFVGISFEAVCFRSWA